MSRVRRWAGQVRTTLRGPRPEADPTEAPEQRLVASPLFDVEWYRLQTGLPLDRTVAVADYLSRGRFAGLTPHPLFDPAEFTRHRADLVGPGEDALAVYLRGHYFKAPVHPFLPMRAYLAAHPGCWEHPDGPIGHYLEHVAPAGVRVNDWYHPTSEQPRGLVDWSVRVAQQLAAARDPAPPGPDASVAEVSVLVPVTGDWFDVPVLLRGLERVASGSVQTVIVDDATPVATAVVLRAVTERFDLRLLRNPEPVGARQALTQALQLAGAPVSMVLDASAEVRRGWNELLAALEDPGVGSAQPLLLRPSGAIHSAGLVVGASGPAHLLAGQPIEDAGEDPFTVDSQAQGCVVVRTEELRAVDGDVAALAGSRLTVPEAWVVLGDAREDLPGLTRPRPRAQVSEPAPRLRWAIKNPAPFFEADLWGDTHFAHQLATSLRSLGQEVVVDHKEEFGRVAGPPDDVNLVLRGLYPWHPTVRPAVDPPGRTGPRVDLMWLISHPELVTAEELAGYDHVHVASTTFARTLTDAWGIPASPLLQATDPTVFHPGLAEPDTGHRLLFVGNSRRVMRTMVRYAVEQQLPVSIYGDYWEGLIPAEMVVATHLPNAEVGAAYRSAGVVLGDHWDPMREGGFISNRVFDALACAARLVSDPVAGLHEVFGDAVRVVHSADELAALVAGDLSSRFPGEQERLALAEKVAREHSFDHRAATLLDQAIRQWRHRADS